MSAEDLLDWSNWTLVVPLTAQEGPPPNPGVGYPTPYEPGPFETSIEFPYALFIAPVVSAPGAATPPTELGRGYDTFFTSRAKPLLNDGISDLWTAALGRNNGALGTLNHLSVPSPQVAAVYATDYFPWQEHPPTQPDATPADVVYYQPVPPK